MIENHDKRVQSFLASASDLDPEQSKEAYDECLVRRDAIEAAWKCLNADFNECNQKIQDNRTLFELLTTMDDMDMFIKEKEKLVQDLNFRDPSHLQNKLKKLVQDLNFRDPRHLRNKLKKLVQDLNFRDP